MLSTSTLQGLDKQRTVTQKWDEPSLLSISFVPDLVQCMNTKSRERGRCETASKQSMMTEFPSEVLLQIFSHLPRSDWKSVRLLSKAWSVSGAKQVFNEIRVGPSDRAMLSLRALSNHEYLREIPSRLRIEAQLVQPHLSIHEFLVRLLRQIRLCSLCWGWPPSFDTILPGSDAIMTHARMPLPLSSVELVWREGELCANAALRSRYTAYLDFVSQQQRWTPSQQRDLLR